MQVFAIMQWKKVHSDGFVCKVSEMFVSKLHGRILKILRADLWENFKKVVSYKQLPSREADAAKLELSNFLSATVKENKKLIASLTSFGSFSFVHQIYHVAKSVQNFDDITPWWSNRWSGFSVLPRKFKLLRDISTKTCGVMICRLMMWILHVNYWTLPVLQENGIFRARKRDLWQKKSLLKIFSWLNWMKRFRR